MTGGADVSRQKRRAEARRLMERGRKSLRQGLTEETDDDTLLGLGLVLHEKLADKGNPARASDAAATAEDVLERSLAKLDAVIDCKRGCAHCCRHSVVSATPPEVFRIAAWLRSGQAVPPGLAVEAVLARCQEKRGATIAEMIARRGACPLLLADECGVYLHRPLSCRQLLSRSVEMCIASMHEGKDVQPFVPAALDRGVLVRILLLGAMRAHGLPDTSYELAGALAIALTTEDAERRWLAGENVLADALITERPVSTQEIVDRTARLIAEHVA